MGRSQTIEAAALGAAFVGIGAFVFLSACTTETVAAPSVVVTSATANSPSASFAFESLDDRPVTSETFRGRPTVLVFLTVTSVRGQAEADFLTAMAAHDGDDVAYAIISIDSRESRELVDIFRTKLHVPFPVAMLDEETRNGNGFFGDVNHEPVVVVLDRRMRPVFRSEGRIVPSSELRTHMRGL